MSPKFSFSNLYTNHSESNKFVKKILPIQEIFCEFKMQMQLNDPWFWILQEYFLSFCSYFFPTKGFCKHFLQLMPGHSIKFLTLGHSCLDKSLSSVKCGDAQEGMKFVQLCIWYWVVKFLVWQLKFFEAPSIFVIYGCHVCR